MKNKQKQIDDKAVEDHKAVGSDNPGGQAWIAPQREVHGGVQDDANAMPRGSIMGKIRKPYKED